MGPAVAFGAALCYGSAAFTTSTPAPWQGAASTTSPPVITVSNSCDSPVDGNYNLLSTLTASGSPVYKHETEEIWIFHDLQCGVYGPNNNPISARWIMSLQGEEPDYTRNFELRNGNCNGYAYYETTNDTAVPITSNWNEQCSGSWAVRSLTTSLPPPPPPPPAPPAPPGEELSSGTIGTIVVGAYLGIAAIAGAAYQALHDQ